MEGLQDDINKYHPMDKKYGIEIVILSLSKNRLWIY